MPSTLFTLGYEKRSLSDYLAILREAEIEVIVDVRETAWSHKPGFSKTALSHALENAGIEYVHAAFAGNPKWLRREATSHRECIENFSLYLATMPPIVDRLGEVIAEVGVAGRSIALTCFERHHGDCHRSILADAWAAEGYRSVEHLAIEGCPRLIRA
jgi:uncharacterized protein (DUF488 family)